MAVSLVDVGIKAPQELNDFRLALLSIVRHAIEGKSLVEIATADFQKLAEAVKGADQVPDAFAEELEKSSAISGLMGGELIGLFLSTRQKPKEAAKPQEKKAELAADEKKQTAHPKKS